MFEVSVNSRQEKPDRSEMKEIFWEIREASLNYSKNYLPSSQQPLLDISYMNFIYKLNSIRAKLAFVQILFTSSVISSNFIQQF